MFFYDLCLNDERLSPRSDNIHIRIKQSLRWFDCLIRIKIFIVLFAANTISIAAPILSGPDTVAIESSDYQHTYYVSIVTGSNQGGDGSQSNPWKNLEFALAKTLDASEINRYAIFVAAGVYKVQMLPMKSYVDLFGGFDYQHWQRDIFQNPTILDGSSKYRILTGANYARMDGFIVQAGRVRGCGAGLLCDGNSPMISNNIFIDNHTKKPKNWSPKYWHEQANDGGAIYCVNGAQPVLKHNIFANNLTEIGRGAAIAMHDHCAGEISHCVFLDNASGIEDLDRSSDGGAISIFNWSCPRIDGNVLLENKAYNTNDGGGIFVALWSSPVINNNLFAGNRSTDDGGALFIGGQEHRYDSPKDLVPDADHFCAIVSNNVFFGNDNRGRNSGGMRLTMQARATVENNLLAHDARLQLQASEVKIVNNTILENTVLDEMPEKMAKNLLDQNIFWARLLVRNGQERKKKISPSTPRVGKEPCFIDDQQIFAIRSSVYRPKKHSTRIQIARGSQPVNQLANRIVRFEHRWGVVKSNANREVIVWGDVTGDSKMIVLPTFQLQPQSP